jgi:hypothetical protein
MGSSQSRTPARAAIEAEYEIGAVRQSNAASAGGPGPLQAQARGCPSEEMPHPPVVRVLRPEIEPSVAISCPGPSIYGDSDPFLSLPYISATPPPSLHGHSAGNAHNNSLIPWLDLAISCEVKKKRQRIFFDSISSEDAEEETEYSCFLPGSSTRDGQLCRAFY